MQFILNAVVSQMSITSYQIQSFSAVSQSFYMQEYRNCTQKSEIGLGLTATGFFGMVRRTELVTEGIANGEL